MGRVFELYIEKEIEFLFRTCVAIFLSYNLSASLSPRSYYVGTKSSLLELMDELHIFTLQSDNFRVGVVATN